MNSENEKKKLRRLKLRYFLAGMISYICVYVICIFLMNGIMILVSVPVYVELILILAFFFVSAWLTKKIVHRKIIMHWVTRN